MRHWTLQEAVIYGKGVERSFLCPVHGDSRPSASLNIVKKLWVCYTCGAKGSLHGEDALIEPDYEVMKTWFDQKLEEHREYPDSWLARWDAGPVHDYWQERVGERAARHFRLGFDADAESGTYPLRNSSGTVLGVVRRSLGGDGPKYRYPRGIDVGRLLFNYTPDARRAVVLVEGALDAIALWNVGVEAFAIYGARLGPAQITLIEKCDPEYVVTAYDNDEAGRKAAWVTEQCFPHRKVERMAWNSAWGKDVDELGPERLKKVCDGLASPVYAELGSQTCDTPRNTKRPHRSSLTTSTLAQRLIERTPA
jgi:5S rRNA maturation endonuclease (ribonuclease M5)